MTKRVLGILLFLSAAYCFGQFSVSQALRWRLDAFASSYTLLDRRVTDLEVNKATKLDPLPEAVERLEQAVEALRAHQPAER